MRQFSLFLVSIFFLASIIALTKAQTNSTKRTLTVVGVGSATTPVTQADISVGIESTQTTATAAQSDVGSKSAKVVDALKEIPSIVTKLKTTSISLSPVYPTTTTSTANYTIIGYRSSNTLSFSVTALDAVGVVLDKLVEVGVNQISGMSFVANESSIAKARGNALQSAVDDAMNKAEIVITRLYPQISRSQLAVSDINIEGGYRPTPIPYFSMARFDNAGGSTSSIPVVGGDQTVDATVTLKVNY